MFKKALLVTSLVSVSLSAMADGSGWINDYAGVALGSATSPNPGIGNNANANVGEVGSEYRVFAGHEFTQNFGIETQYNHYHGFGGNMADGSAHSFDLLGTGTYYFDRANTIGLVGKAGFNYSTVGSYGLTNGGFGWVYGAGLRYNVSRQFDIRADYQRDQLGYANNYFSNAENTYTIGAAYHF
ncbi:MAG: porin family protein [Ferrovum myxofaciens]|uniref:porin family protein n=1 Tax=Ferrovum myxofaciens TaxID=416213 RepID=UPI0023560986|nr:porin family protein [Ferrovum myxofaciens]QKE41247.1 MAG: porin family protein [Ferrovum myxofaciens]